MKRITLLLAILILSTGIAMAQKTMKTTTATVVLIPDSIVIAGKDTSYLVITGGNGFLTKNYDLYRQIIDHMKNDTVRNDGIENVVLLEGAYIGALSKFYKGQFGKKDIDKTRAIELNGYLYRITGYKLDFKLSEKLFLKEEKTIPVAPVPVPTPVQPQPVVPETTPVPPAPVKPKVTLDTKKSGYELYKKQN